MIDMLRDLRTSGRKRIRRAKRTPPNSARRVVCVADAADAHGAPARRVVSPCQQSV
jgi:hypothetical protein